MLATASRPYSSSMLSHAHNSGSKRAQLEPHTAERKVQGAESWGAFTKNLPATRQRRWWWRIFLLTRQNSGMNRTCFGFWLKEGETPSPLCRKGIFFWIYAFFARISLFWASGGHGASAAERVPFPQPSPQTWCTKGGNWRICAQVKQLPLLFI